MSLVSLMAATRTCVAERRSRILILEPRVLLQLNCRKSALGRGGGGLGEAPGGDGAGGGGRTEKGCRVIGLDGRSEGGERGGGLGVAAGGR